jgi:hypothetical protein
MSKVRSSSWTRLVSAVLVALMGVGGLGIGPASSQDSVEEFGNVVLYPLIVKDDPRVVTLVTYIGPNFSDSLDDRPNGLHYQYHSKGAVSPTLSTDSCVSSSIPGNSSPNDVLTFDSSGFFGTQPFFNDNTSEGVLGLNLIAPSPSLAYLLINAIGGQGPNFGEAEIVDLANGGIWGYNAVAIPEGANGTQIGGGAALISGTRRPVHLYPPTVATTQFAVTPMGTDMLGSNANRSRLQMQLSSPPAGGSNFGGVYDVNENPIDFSVFARVRCVWIFPLSALVGSAALDRASWRASGGWGWLSNNPSGPEGTTPPLDVAYNQNAIVFKIMSAGSAGSFVIDGLPVTSALFGHSFACVRNGETSASECPGFD